MATKNMAYDNPAYQAVLAYGGSVAAGASGTSPRFVAFCTTLLKSVSFKATTAGTAADIKTLLINSGSATSTTVLATMTAAYAGTGTTCVLAATTLTAGDAAWILTGSDATEVIGVTFELVLAPGATVSA